MHSGNQLGDEGFSRLVPVLSTLPNLGVLDVSCNGITDASLNRLASALEESSSTNNRILQVFISGRSFCIFTLALIFFL
jgi:Leucine-rich repeat (LRR) protein